MFRELIDAWRNTNPLKEMYEELVGMIETEEWMFNHAWEAALRGKVSGEIKDEIYRRDIDVNRSERSIRKRVVEHLTVQPGKDVAACLILMSVVKDAERIGDYCKNIMGVTKFGGKQLEECSFSKTFTDIKLNISDMFARTGRALRESDALLGSEIVRDERELNERCDSLIESLATQEGLDAKSAIQWVLLARYLKRVTSHLGNLASGLVMPVHKLDYYDEKLLPGDQPPPKK